MIKKDGKAIYGICKLSDKGQILIPKEARDDFNLKPNDTLVLLGDLEQGLALVKSEVFDAVTNQLFGKEKKVKE